MDSTWHVAMHRALKQLCNYLWFNCDLSSSDTCVSRRSKIRPDNKL